MFFRNISASDTVKNKECDSGDNMMTTAKTRIGRSASVTVHRKQRRPKSCRICKAVVLIMGLGCQKARYGYEAENFSKRSVTRLLGEKAAPQARQYV